MRLRLAALAVLVALDLAAAATWLNATSVSIQMDETNGNILKLVDSFTHRSFALPGGVVSPLEFETSSTGASRRTFSGSVMNNFSIVESTIHDNLGQPQWSCLNLTWSNPNASSGSVLGTRLKIRCSICAATEATKYTNGVYGGKPVNPRQSGLLARVDAVSGLPASRSLASITFPVFLQPPQLALSALDHPGCTVFDTDWLHPRFAKAPCKEVIAVTGTAVDQLVLNRDGGFLVPQPGMQTEYPPSATYPGQASFQLIARTDGMSGIGMMTLDGAGNVKVFTGAMKARQSVQLTIKHLVPEVAGGVCDYTVAPRDDPGNCTVTVPYAMAIFGFTGGWRSAADVYKAWVVAEAPWAGETVATRTDIPSALQDGAIGWIGPVNTAQGFNPAPFGPNLQNVSVKVAQFREMTGTRHVAFLPYGWEHDGTWAGIDYFPASPSSEDWFQVSQDLAAQGDILGMLVSGFWWVVKRQQTSSGPAFDNSAQVPALKDMLSKLPNQSLWMDDQYISPDGTQSWRGLSLRLCHGHPNATATMQTIAETCNRRGSSAGVAMGLGATLVSFDQEIGGGSAGPCYAHNNSADGTHQHDHAPGHGAWMWRGFRDTLDGIRSAAVTADREVGLMMEQCSELASTRASTYWSRQFAVIDYPSINARGLGVFSYLYHENVTALAAAMVQGQGDGKPTDTLRRQAIANAVIRGLPPVPFYADVAPRFLGQSLSSSWEANVTRSFAASSPLFASATRFLLQGRTLRPPTMQCGTVKTSVARQSRQAELSLGSATIGAFSLPLNTSSETCGEDLGLPLVSIVDEPQTVTIELSSYVTACSPTSSVTRVLAANGTELASYAGVPASILVPLDPIQTVLIELRAVELQ